MSTKVQGLSPALQADRELSVLQLHPKLGILVAIHLPGNPQSGWAIWVQPRDLEGFARDAVAAPNADPSALG